MRPFALENARDTADALRLASVGAAAQYLAGGTNLLDLMKLDVMRPERVVNISALRREHSAIEAGASGLRLGALVRMSEAADHPVIRRDYPVLAQSLSKGGQSATAQYGNARRQCIAADALQLLPRPQLGGLQ